MNIEILPLLVVGAFFCELIDSSLGMGYGTTLVPILLLLGYDPLQVVPAVLLSEFATGVAAGVFHQEFGNVNFRPGTRDFKVMLLMTGLSIIGVLAAVVVAVNIPAWALKAYVGLLVLGIGIVILWYRDREVEFSWRRVGIMGLIAAFNKGMSGGGYGPVVTGGQVLSGVGSRNAIGIASLAEGITSAVGFAAYMVSGAPFPVMLAPSLLLGALISTPVAAYVVSRCQMRRLTTMVGGSATLLGAYTLINLFI
ncbi:MAG: sulfite exporter TauE/SafE family protein [Chloroflexota bacterium]|nr:sulfite exporter TauE/SafE family protein [Chloroflexota bacterium]